MLTRRSITTGKIPSPDASLSSALSPASSGECVRQSCFRNLHRHHRVLMRTASAYALLEFPGSLLYHRTYGGLPCSRISSIFLFTPGPRASPYYWRISATITLRAVLGARVRSSTEVLPGSEALTVQKAAQTSKFTKQIPPRKDPLGRWVRAWISPFGGHGALIACVHAGCMLMLPSGTLTACLHLTRTAWCCL